MESGITGIEKFRRCRLTDKVPTPIRVFWTVGRSWVPPAVLLESWQAGADVDLIGGAVGGGVAVAVVIDTDRPGRIDAGARGRRRFVYRSWTMRVVMSNAAPPGSRPVVWSHWPSVRSRRRRPVPGLATKRVVADGGGSWPSRLPRPAAVPRACAKCAPVRGLVAEARHVQHGRALKLRRFRRRNAKTAGSAASGCCVP